MKIVSWNDFAEKYAAEREMAYSTFVEAPAVIEAIGDVRGKYVLDAGCAGGYFTRKLDYLGANIIGIDVSPRMLKWAKKKDKKQEYFEMDARYIGFKDESFDVVLSSLLLNNIPEYETALEEFNRILKLSGKLVFSVLNPNYTESKKPEDGYIYEHWPTLMAESERVKLIHRTTKEYEDGLSDAGFNIENLIVLKPQEELKKINPEIYEKRLKNPAFLVVKAGKVS